MPRRLDRSISIRTSTITLGLGLGLIAACGRGDVDRGDERRAASAIEASAPGGKRPSGIALTAPWSEMALPRASEATVRTSTPELVELELVGKASEVFALYLAHFEQAGWKRHPAHPIDEGAVAQGMGSTILFKDDRRLHVGAMGLDGAPVDVTVAFQCPGGVTESGDCK